MGGGGGSDERESTLNQILTEMDGFEGNTGIIILAATNRADVLDPALLRPGRFDRRVPVDLPDVSGRLSILKVHAKGKPLGPTASLEKTAKRTIGFSGASLANLMNEAAIVAARRSKTEISADEIDYAIDRIQVRHVTPHLSPATPTFSHPISPPCIPHICRWGCRRTRGRRSPTASGWWRTTRRGTPSSGC